MNAAQAGALLVVAVDLADGGVQVDGHRGVAGSGAGRSRRLQGLFGEPVELATGLAAAVHPS